MKVTKFHIFAFLFLLNCALTNAQNIVVDDSYTAQQLVENVLVNSPCATVSNFSVTGDPFSAGQESYGFFSYVGTDFPFASGIVLSTSRANRTAGPNDNLIDEGSPSWIGDNDLEQAISVAGTLNATALEFDFTPLTSQISFDYIFASEEYQGTAPCKYSDGFAFLLKVAGSTDTYQNLALIPNTTTPVKVTSVHPNIPGGNGCSAQNEEYFGGYNGAIHPINFNGQTVVMTAKSDVIPGTTYHIKLVIADEVNIRYDSAIFLGGGSFNVGTNIGPDRLEATNNPVCSGETIVLDATETGLNTYQWFKNSVAIVGETNPTYTVTSAGTYEVEVAINGTPCIAKGKAIIEYSDLPVLNNQTLYQCDENTDGITKYNLTSLNSAITGGNPDITDVKFFQSLTEAQSNSNPIANPTNYQNVIANQIIYATAKNQFGCYGIAQIELKVPSNTLPNIAPIYTCDVVGSQDGITNFDLNTLVGIPLSGSLPTGLTFAYYVAESNAILNTSPLNTTFTNTIANHQTIYVKILDGINCYGILPIDLNVNTFDPSNFGDQTIYLCSSESKTLAVASGFSSYIWSNGQTGNLINVTTSGIYTVTVTNANGCEKTKRFEVIASSTATITNVIVNDFSGNSNAIEIVATGIGDYEYSIDGINFQDSPTFSSLEPNEYTVYVNDKNGCPITSKSVYVLDYPHFFTPNEDGINDIWRIQKLQFLAKSRIYIFDRFGKLLFSFNENQAGWNGKYNGIDLPSTDYWFVLKLNNGRTIKGNFSLVR